MAHKKIETIDFQDVTGRFSSWDEYIVKCKARDFYTPLRNVIKVNSTDSIKTVLSAMFSYQLQALPVYDPDADKYKAFVDTYDIVSYLLKVREIAEKEKNVDIKHPKKNQITLSHELAELDIPVGEAMNYAQNNFLFMLPEETMLREIMYVMGMGEKHRVWIYHKDKDMGSGLITQTKMLQLLQEDLKHFPDIANKTLEDLGLAAPKDIISVSLDTKVLEGFKTMVSHNVQSLAILDKDGKLENQFSSNDIRLLALFGDFFSNVELSITEYLEKVHQYCNRPRGSRVCRSTDTLIDVIKKLTSLRIHRLFMIDADEKPISVVSIGDILRSIWPFCAQ